MSAAKHTPGPWSLEEGNPFTVVHNDGDDTPWFVATAHVGLAPGVAEANARLIAAAPEMLAAAKALMRRLESLVGSYEFGTDNDIHAIRAAIAKAEGRSDG